jgi:hypothetical protein
MQNASRSGRIWAALAVGRSAPGTTLFGAEDACVSVSPWPPIAISLANGPHVLPERSLAEIDGDFITVGQNRADDDPAEHQVTRAIAAQQRGHVARDNLGANPRRRLYARVAPRRSRISRQRVAARLIKGNDSSAASASRISDTVGRLFIRGDSRLSKDIYGVPYGVPE